MRPAKVHDVLRARCLQADLHVMHPTHNRQYPFPPVLPEFLRECAPRQEPHFQFLSQMRSSQTNQIYNHKNPDARYTMRQTQLQSGFRTNPRREFQVRGRRGCRLNK